MIEPGIYKLLTSRLNIPNHLKIKIFDVHLSISVRPIYVGFLLRYSINTSCFVLNKSFVNAQEGGRRYNKSRFLIHEDIKE
jgi:hypothetical protein